MKLTKILKIPITDDIIEKIGFSDYDDEHATWGNRRLWFGDFTRDEYDKWYCLQIIDYGDWPEENGRPEGFSYSNWFEYLPAFRTMKESGHVDFSIGWDLNTIADIYKIIYLYHKPWIGDFKKLLIEKFNG